GMGLGLSISDSLVRHHRGHLSLKSDPEAPVRFEIWIPEDTGLPSAEPGDAKVTTRQAGRILLIDDEGAIRRSYARLLRPLHDVVLAADGQAALELLTDDPEFDLILCDLLMPRLDGMELYRRVRARAPRVAERFVFLSGDTASPESRAFLE